MKRKPTDITVYWDSQDPDNEVWAYRASDDQGDIDSGSIDLVSDSDLDGAVDEACHMLDVDRTHDDFACDPVTEGGYATWSHS